MSSYESQTVDAFHWIDAGTRWGVVAGGTTLVLVLVVVVLVLCMRGEKEKDGYEKSRSPYFHDPENSPADSSSSGTGGFTIQGKQRLSTLGPPPPYCLTNPEQIQPGAPHIFGPPSHFAPQLLAPPPPNGANLPPQYDEYGLSPGHSDHSTSSEDEEEQIGKVWFSAKYDEQNKTLQVEILKARILAVRDRSSVTAETFIKLTLLPDQKETFQTKSKKKTMTPKFNETFTFKDVGSPSLGNQFLRISACISEKLFVTSLGHILLNLEDVRPGEVMLRELAHYFEPSPLGELNFSMSYHPKHDKLRLTINKCRNLQNLVSRENASTSMYIKAQLICGRRQLDLQTTSLKPADLNIDFNEKMIFTLTQKQMRTASVVITIMRSTPEKLEAPFEEIYSSVTVGPYTFLHKEGLRHWQEILTYPRTRISQWHGLR